MENPKIDLAVRTRVMPDSEILKLFKEGEIGCILDWEVRDGLFQPDGKLVEVGKKKAESFLVQFMEYLWACMNGISTQSGMLSKRTDGTFNTIQMGQKGGIIGGGAGSILDGIIVGSGIAAAQVTDFVIQTIINHGAGAGQLNYGAVSFGAPAADATTSQYTITRNFANASGGGVTVNEIGLYVNYVNNYQTSLPNNYFMWLHDVIAGGIVVNNGQTLTINYRPQAVI